MENWEVVGTIRNEGCGGCCALYFCGKLKMEVVYLGILL